MLALLIPSLLLTPMIPTNPNYKDWTKEASQLLETRYWSPKDSLYIEQVDGKGVPNNQAAFMWDMGIVLAGYAAAIRIDRKTYLPLFEKAFQTIEPYWLEGHGIKGYAVLPRQSDPDRYYDDNAWVALALVEAYEATKDKRYLERSKETFKFVLSGEDEELGGGIYWHEHDKGGKNTCSNAPSINVALRLYRATKDKQYLETALRLHKWTKQLQDTDGLYLDNINKKGHFERTKWTYNTALMLRAECLFYQITKEKQYLDEAVRVAEAAWKHWYIADKKTIRDGAAFAHHLFEAFLEVVKITKDKKWREDTLPILSYVHDHTRTSLGIYGGAWDQTPSEDGMEYKLLTQASALRAYAMAATAK